ncbi:hypothetical protein Tco_1141670 [Tanacetum coccineum]
MSWMRKEKKGSHKKGRPLSAPVEVGQGCTVAPLLVHDTETERARSANAEAEKHEFCSGCHGLNNMFWRNPFICFSLEKQSYYLFSDAWTLTRMLTGRAMELNPTMHCWDSNPGLAQLSSQER